MNKVLRIFLIIMLITEVLLFGFWFLAYVGFIKHSGMMIIQGISLLLLSASTVIMLRKKE